MNPAARDNPFTSSFDVVHYFLGRHQQEAAAHLSYALTEGEGFTVITGERGAGKTSACRAFLSSLTPARAAVAYLSGPQHNSGELLGHITRQFGLETAGESVKEMIDALNGFLMQQRVAGRKAVVFIDDAQTLPAEVLEQVRLISNLETTRDKLVQIVLIGEPGLLELLDSRELRQMGQRVSVCYEIGPLTEEETAAYIRQRMDLQGRGALPEFGREAVGVIFRHTQGNPRRINRVCATALDLARERKADTIGRALAVEATGEFAAQPGRRRRGRLLLATAAAGIAGILIAIAAVRLATREEPADLPVTAEPAALSPPATPEMAQLEQPPAKPKPDLPATAAQEPPPAPPPPAATPPPMKPPVPVPGRMTHSVQVGAFLVPDNARQLVARLGSRGVRATIVDLRDSQGRTWHTVRVGDFPSRRAAQAYAEEFARREQMTVLVRPFGSF